eukprot:GHVT01072597.1.p2 GENE.GHVT01072597.1~~GHVT01072597.1.p2  ORF type:complete len:318 (+),score=101.19 GHVT01072597.1:393-1346(+)
MVAVEALAPRPLNPTLPLAPSSSSSTSSSTSSTSSSVSSSASSSVSSLASSSVSSWFSALPSSRWSFPSRSFSFSFDGVVDELERWLSSACHSLSSLLLVFLRLLYRLQLPSNQAPLLLFPTFAWLFYPSLSRAFWERFSPPAAFSFSSASLLSTGYFKAALTHWHSFPLSGILEWAGLWLLKLSVLQSIPVAAGAAVGSCCSYAPTLPSSAFVLSSAANRIARATHALAHKASAAVKHIPLFPRLGTLCLNAHVRTHGYGAIEEAIPLTFFVGEEEEEEEEEEEAEAEAEAGAGAEGEREGEGEGEAEGGRGEGGE